MTNINFNSEKHHYNVETKTFTMSEKDVRFDTQYNIKNLKTGNSELFDFVHSTGPEFDPNTKWIYKSQTGLTLEVCNDKEITEQLAKNYLEHKLKH